MPSISTFGDETYILPGGYHPTVHIPPRQTSKYFTEICRTVRIIQNVQTLTVMDVILRCSQYVI